MDSLLDDRVSVVGEGVASAGALLLVHFRAELLLRLQKPNRRDKYLFFSPKSLFRSHYDRNFVWLRLCELSLQLFQLSFYTYFCYLIPRKGHPTRQSQPGNEHPLYSPRNQRQQIQTFVEAKDTKLRKIHQAQHKKKQLFPQLFPVDVQKELLPQFSLGRH